MQISVSGRTIAMFARQCGGHGVKVSSADALDEPLRQALAHPGPSLVEEMTDAELV